MQLKGSSVLYTVYNRVICIVHTLLEGTMVAITVLIVFFSATKDGKVVRKPASEDLVAVNDISKHGKETTAQGLHGAVDALQSSNFAGS